MSMTGILACSADDILGLIASRIFFLRSLSSSSQMSAFFHASMNFLLDSLESISAGLLLNLGLVSVGNAVSLNRIEFPFFEITSPIEDTKFLYVCVGAYILLDMPVTKSSFTLSHWAGKDSAISKLSSYFLYSFTALLF